MNHDVSMTISEVSILPVKPQNGLLGFVSFVLNHAFFVGNVAIYSRPDGSSIRLVFPTKVLPNGKEISVIHPITQDCYNLIAEAVTKALADLAKKVANKNTFPSKTKTNPPYFKTGLRHEF